MYKKRLAALTALMALGIAACGGGGVSSTPSTTPPPSGTTVAASGTVITATGVTGTTSSVTVSGTGIVNATETATQPTGLPVLQSVARAATASVKAAAAVTNTPLVYIAISAATAATISSLPAVTATFATAPSGTVYLAYYTGSAWSTVAGPATVSGSTVSFGVTSFATPISLAAGASIYLAIYSGGVLGYVAPTASPSPSPTATATATAAPTAAASVIADGSFESGVVGSTIYQGSIATINATGWSQCSVSTVTAGTYSGGINGQATGGAAPYAGVTAPPASTYAPTAATSPAAVIVTSGASAPAGTSSTAPPVTVSSAPTAYAGTHMAQFGQLLNNYNAGNWYYNGLCQNITVASGGGTFTGYAWSYGNELNKYVENVVGVVTGTSASSMTLTNLLYMENVRSSTSSGDSAWRPITFSVPGGSQTLFIGMWTSAGSSTGSTSYSYYWWLDALAIH
jgi:hypothetical protein